MELDFQLDQQEKAEFDRLFNCIIENLEDKLILAAERGDSEYSVNKFSANSVGRFENISNSFNQFIPDGENRLTAWDKKIINAELVKTYMVGNMNRVYDYCQKHDFSPQIRYWYSDDGDDGFEIFIKW